MADGQGGTVGKVIGGVLSAASQGNLLLAGVVQAITLYRQARAAWRASRPQDPGDWLDDAALIDLLKQDSDKLVNHANDLLKKYAAGPTTQG